MAESLADKLRETTEQARRIQEELRLEEGRQNVAAYVSPAVLKATILNTDKQLMTDAALGNDTTTLYWSVRYYKSSPWYVGNNFIGPAINPEKIADESASVISMRAAVADHYNEKLPFVQFSERDDKFEYHSPTGFGTVFVVTGKVYGLHLSWVNEETVVE
jgi:hypothetical protein